MGTELGLVEIGSTNTEAVFYRGSGNHPFQAVAMEGTTPGVVVIGMSLNDEMTQLQMHPPLPRWRPEQKNQIMPSDPRAPV